MSVQDYIKSLPMAVQKQFNRAREQIGAKLTKKSSKAPGLDAGARHRSPLEPQDVKDAEKAPATYRHPWGVYGGHPTHNGIQTGTTLNAYDWVNDTSRAKRLRHTVKSAGSGVGSNLRVFLEKELASGTNGGEEDSTSDFIQREKETTGESLNLIESVSDRPLDRPLSDAPLDISQEQ